MNNLKLTQRQGWNGIYIFLRSLWERSSKKFACHGIGLGSYLNFYNSFFEDDYEWRRIFTITFHRAWNESESLSSDDLFKMAEALLAKYKKKYKFDLFIVEAVLQNMKTNPSQEEWMLWEEACNASLLGKQREWLEEYRET